MHVLAQIGFVSLGGALGSLLRWGVGVALTRWLGTAFPYGTFCINLTGSLFIGWFVTMLAERFTGSAWISKENLHLMVAVGFTGAYTTFSTFEYDTDHLLRGGDGLKALTYVVGSVFLGLVAVRLGIMLAKWGN